MDDAAPRARVVVLAGPSGSGKTSLARRSGLPTVSLDDFYRDGDHPGLPRPGGRVDWEDPRSWDAEAAVRALVELCTTGRAELPTYSIGANRRTGSRRIGLDGARAVVAEGVFAAEITEACRAEGILADALVLRVARPVTFWRRLVRDQRERRKPFPVLVRQGLAKLRAERRVVARQVALGCRPVRRDAALAALRAAAGQPAGGSAPLRTAR